MTNKDFTILIGPLMAIFVLTVFFLSLFNSKEENKEDQSIETNIKSNIISRTNIGGAWQESLVLVTIRHDGHLFIICERFDKGGIIHHPDCPCKNKEIK